MRTNLPVTDIEHLLDDDAALVSITDLDSRITYANPTFVEISGFSIEELVGEPHNLVRHPDMPPEAFADLWRTIRAGHQWTALVKNRCKNGDYYWVKANVTPLVKDGRPVGYMSVRIKPSREDVARAGALYKEIQAGKSRYGIRGGDVVRTDWLGKLAAWTRIGVSARIWIAMLVMMLIAIGVETATLFGSNAGATGAGFDWLRWIAASTSSLVVAGALGWWLNRSVAQPLQAVALMAQRIAGADLTGRIDTSRQDVIGRAIRGLNQTSVNLEGVVSNVRAQAHAIHAAASEITSGVIELSGRTESQASNLEETAASMEEIHATVQQTAELAREANQLALSASTVAEQGGQVVGQVVTNMADINTSSTKIADIIGVIDEIAFQTNILALNAAVEAARAGEQGRGFAVVAGEVRNLAQKTATAAKEIKTLISDSLGKVESGAKLSQEAGKTMADMVDAIKRVTAIMGDIGRATAEQASGIAQVNEAAMQLDRATQENAAFAEKITATAKTMNVQADTLLEAVGIFTVG
ncbi:MAG TPA: methyl-accepting chemotaxis protein [Candidatus Competibacter sp.]|nr:methyl-accepting chemotaxis protein [Candidatus Competibacter sp.]